MNLLMICKCNHISKYVRLFYIRTPNFRKVTDVKLKMFGACKTFF